MNCDQVFDILTRGPFPTGTACDAPVEAHLNVCAECRRLAEALRPAVELFQEAVDPEESRDLPGYWCSVTADLPQGAVSFAREVEPRAAERRVRPSATPGHISALTAWRMAAMLAIGLTLGTLASGRFLNGDLNWSLPESPSHAAAPPADGPMALLLSKAEIAVLPAICYGRTPLEAPRYTEQSGLLAEVRLEDMTCCSGCHNAGSDAVPSAATVKAAQSCQLCHNDPARFSSLVP